MNSSFAHTSVMSVIFQMSGEEELWVPTQGDPNGPKIRASQQTTEVSLPRYDIDVTLHTSTYSWLASVSKGLFRILVRDLICKSASLFSAHFNPINPSLAEFTVARLVRVSDIC